MNVGNEGNDNWLKTCCWFEMGERFKNDNIEKNGMMNVKISDKQTGTKAADWIAGTKMEWKIQWKTNCSQKAKKETITNHTYGNEFFARKFEQQRDGMYENR